MSGEEVTGDKCSNATARYVLVYSRWIGTNTHGVSFTLSTHNQQDDNGSFGTSFALGVTVPALANSYLLTCFYRPLKPA